MCHIKQFLYQNSKQVYTKIKVQANTVSTVGIGAPIPTVDDIFETEKSINNDNFFIFLHVHVKGFFYKLFKNIIDTCRKFLLTAEQDRNKAGSVG